MSLRSVIRLVETTASWSPAGLAQRLSRWDLAGEPRRRVEDRCAAVAVPVVRDRRQRFRVAGGRRRDETRRRSVATQDPQGDSQGQLHRLQDGCGVDVDELQPEEHQLRILGVEQSHSQPGCMPPGSSPTPSAPRPPSARSGRDSHAGPGCRCPGVRPAGGRGRAPVTAAASSTAVVARCSGTERIMASDVGGVDPQRI